MLSGSASRNSTTDIGLGEKMKKYKSVQVEVTEVCPFCGTPMTYKGVGITTYGQVDIWNCHQDGDTWIGAGRLANLGLTLA